MQIIFMGSPEFAVPSLEAIHNLYEICLVVTQPDRPAGRGKRLRESTVKQTATAFDLPTLQPKTLREHQVYSELRDLHPDLIVVAAYGEILPNQILELPTYGSLNVHASLLPRWRGAAPVQAAILAGDDKTGVTIMKMDAGMDTGPILSQQSTTIGDDETGGELQSRLADLGGELLIDTIPDYISGRLEPVPQDDDLATYAPMLKKQNGRIDLSLSAEKLSRQVLAFEPWPKSFFFWGDLRIVIKAAHPQTTSSGAIGDIVKLDGSPAIITTTGALVLDRIQPAGKREMPGRDFLNGYPDFIGSNLRAHSSDR